MDKLIAVSLANDTVVTSMGATDDILFVSMVIFNNALVQGPMPGMQVMQSAKC